MNAHRNKWMQIKDCTPSSDFYIRSDDKIKLEFKGNVMQVDGLPKPIITFIPNGNCFVESQLQCLEADEMGGKLLMHHDTEQKDWKPLKWESMKANYENEGI